MAANILLIRHAAHSRVDTILCGRMPGVGLGAEGHRQSKLLAERLTGRPIDAVYSSPLQRCSETAAHLSGDVQISEAVNEIDFGRWTGMAFSDLATDPLWQQWNAERSRAQAPGGEFMLDVQQRIVTELATRAARHDGQSIAVVSHGDVIKAALIWWLGCTLDGWSRFEIAPASISEVRIGADQGVVVCMNNTLSA